MFQQVSRQYKDSSWLKLPFLLPDWKWVDAKSSVHWCRSYSLPVKDHGGRKWEFVIKSWANGTENRRVYVLEQTGEYLKVLSSHCMHVVCIRVHSGVQ